MFRFQPRKRRYFGSIILGSQPINWMKRPEHRRFASKEWFEGQVRYGEWIKERNRPNHYQIYTTVYDRLKPITVLIKIKCYPSHVLVYHSHVLKKKK